MSEMDLIPYTLIQFLHLFDSRMIEYDILNPYDFSLRNQDNFSSWRKKKAK